MRVAGRFACERVLRVLLSGLVAAVGAGAEAQRLVTDAPVANVGGTAYVGKYTSTSVFSAGPTFHFTAPVTITSVQYDPGPGGVQELGVRALNACSYNQVTAAETVCGIETEIVSVYQGWRYGTLRVTTTGGVFTVPVEWESVGSQVSITPGTLTNGLGGASATGNSLTVDAVGNVYLSGGNVVRKIDAATGAVRMVAGVAGNADRDGDGGPATAAHIGSPVDVAASPAGDVYFVSSAPLANDAVRKVDGGTGVISTVANFVTGRAPTLGSSGGQGTDGAVAVDDQGNIYASVTHDNALTVTAGNGGAQRFLIGSAPGGSQGCNVGSGNNALFAPTTLAVNGGYVYFASGAAVYKISEDTSACHAPVLVAGTGVAGNSGDDGLATKAAFGLISGIAVDAAGDVYLADATDNTVRMVSAATGTISTIAGASSALPGVTVAPGWASLALDVRGNLYVLSATGTVQKIDVSTSSLSFAQTAVSATSSDDAKSVLFTNIGNDALPDASPALPANFAWDRVSTCGVGAAAQLSAGASCVAAVDFMPLAAGDLSGTISLGDARVVLSGVGGRGEVAQPTYSVKVLPGAVTLQQGQSGTAQFLFAPAGGYKGVVSFACEGLPAGASCSFAPASLAADGSNTQQASALTVTTRGSASSIAENRLCGTGTTLASLAGFNGMLLMWLKLRRKGALPIRLLAVVLLFSMGAAGMTGCGSGGSPVSPGSYTPLGSTTVKVVATSATDASTETATFVLTVK